MKCSIQFQIINKGQLFMDIFDRIFENNEKLEEADRLWHELQEIEQLIKECEDSDKLEKLKIKKINLDRKLNECFGR